MKTKLNPNAILNQASIEACAENSDQMAHSSESEMIESVINYIVAQHNVFRPLLRMGKMPSVHFQILKTLSKRTMMRMGELAETLAISRPNLTPAIDKLVEQNYVERKECLIDRRATNIALTGEGLKALKSENDMISKGVSCFTSKFNADEQDKLKEALRILSELISKS